MNKHLVFAVLAGMFAPCLGLVIWSVADLVFFHVDDIPLLGAMFFSMFALVYTVPAVLLYGLPLFLLFRLLRLANIFTCVLTALLPIVIAPLIPRIGASLEALLSFGFFFLISALSFWFFARNTIRPNPTFNPDVLSERRST